MNGGFRSLLLADPTCCDSTDGAQRKWQGIKNKKQKKRVRKLFVLLHFSMIQTNFSSSKSVRSETPRLLRDPIQMCLCLLEVPGDGSPAEPSRISPRSIAQSAGLLREWLSLCSLCRQSPNWKTSQPSRLLQLGSSRASCDPAVRMSGCHLAGAAETLPALPVWPLREAIIFYYLP